MSDIEKLTTCFGNLQWLLNHEEVSIQPLPNGHYVVYGGGFEAAGGTLVEAIDNAMDDLRNNLTD